MNNKVNFLIFIPARAGSKGIKNKNMKMLGNLPLIGHTLEFSKKLSIADDIFISTDSDEVIEYCRNFDYKIDYIRPKDLAQDTSNMVETLIDGIDWYEENNNKVVENIILLQPTSPIRSLELINKAINQYLEMDCKSMISVSRMKESIFNCIEFQDNEKIKWKYIDPPLKKNHQRQELKDKTAHIDGNFYIFSNQFLRKNNSVISQEETVPYLIDSKYSIDIDEEEDFIIANLILQSLTNES